jgi:hypothetical protein
VAGGIIHKPDRATLWVPIGIAVLGLLVWALLAVFD